MTEYSSVEEYAAHVRQELLNLPGAMCDRFGPTHPCTLHVVGLLTEATGIVNQAAMAREVAAGPDLAALSKLVDPTAASHSETPFEDD